MYHRYYKKQTHTHQRNPWNHHTEGGTKKWNLFVKNYILILTYLNFSHLQRALHLMQYSYRGVFATAQRQFLNSSILMPFSASAIFLFVCFTSSILAKCFPLRTFLFQGNKKKVVWGEYGWIGRVGHAGHAVFVKKFWKFSEVWAGVLINHPHEISKCIERVFTKKFTGAKCSLSQKEQLVHWYRWVPRTLTHQGKPVLQGASLLENNSILGRSLHTVYLASCVPYITRVIEKGNLLYCTMDKSIKTYNIYLLKLISNNQGKFTKIISWSICLTF